VAEDRILFIFQTRENDVNKLSVILNPGTGSEKEIPMHFLSSTDGLDFYEAITKINERKLSFLFKVEDGGKIFYFDSKNISKTLKSDNAFSVDLDKIEVFKTPDWVKHAVFYQIFPERFYNADPANDQNKDKPRPTGTPWNLSDSYLESWETGKPSWGNYFGGDLKGVEEKIPYMEELGITAIYFNPIFESLSNHKYDTINYLQIDDNFGTNEHFKSLVKTLNAKGINVVLDGVFNHTADEFIQFEDIKKNGPKSQYYNWFHIKKWPFPENFDDKNKPSDYYDCWWGFGDLPKLNTDNEDVRKMLLNVGSFWINEAGIDGWRLDVPNEVPHPFWKEFRKVVKGADPNAYIVGEIWDNAYAWLKGDEFDAVMNYRFKDACTDFFAKRTITPSEFHKRQMAILLDYPRQAYLVLLNLLDSHDTERFLTLCNGDKDRFKLAVLCQMTMPGAPMVYYGDEIGMEGGKDPDNRRPMRWNKETWDTTLLEYYKKLIKIRKQYTALSTGEYYGFYMDDRTGVYSYIRKDETGIFLVLFNNTNNANSISLQVNRIDEKVTGLSELLQGKEYTAEDGKIKLDLEPNSGYLFKVKM
ncbi:MAG: glycoside hydrolase family 13 protein, partial [bacterium]|nr:glycoside hydrolase family 13 protein [bacterium]